MIDLYSYPREIVVSKIIHGEEVWRPIQGFTNLYISSKGRVCSTRNSEIKILKCRADKDGYLVITLREGSNYSKDFKVHRLVAIHFIQNPFNYPLVNHIDGAKINNTVENLEWCNHSHNANEAIRIGLISKDPIWCFDRHGELIFEYNNTTEIVQAGYKYNNIYACLTKRTETAYGLVWKFKSECWIV